MKIKKVLNFLFQGLGLIFILWLFVFLSTYFSNNVTDSSDKNLYGDLLYSDLLLDDNTQSSEFTCPHHYPMLLPSEMNTKIAEIALLMREHNYEKAKNILKDVKTYTEWDELLTRASYEYLSTESDESLQCIKTVLNKYATTYLNNLSNSNQKINIQSCNDFAHLFYNQDIFNAQHLMFLINSYSIVEDKLDPNERSKIKNYLGAIKSNLYQYVHLDIDDIRWNNHEFLDYISIGIYALYFKNETLVNESEFYIKKMLDEFVNSEGFWFEDSTYYHNLILFNLLKYIEAKKVFGYKNNFDDPEFSKHIKKMFNFLLSISHYNNGTYMIPEINDGYIRKLDKRIINIICREYGADYKDLCQNHPVISDSLILPESGLAIFKSEAPLEQTYFLLDFGKPLNLYKDSYFIKNGGSHENYNKLNFNINYKNVWLINEDRYQYKNDYKRLYLTLGQGGAGYSHYDYFNYYKQTWSKNTIVVDKKAQKKCNGELEGYYFSNDLDIVSVKTDSCYPNMLTKRTIYFLKPHIFIIKDNILSNDTHIFESFIHPRGNLETFTSKKSYSSETYTCYSKSVEHKSIDSENRECEYIINYTVLNKTNLKFIKNNIGSNLFFIKTNDSILKYSEGDSKMPLLSLERVQKDFDSIILIELFENNPKVYKVDLINDSFDNSLLRINEKIINLNEFDNLMIK